MNVRFYNVFKSRKLKFGVLNGVVDSKKKRTRKQKILQHFSGEKQKLSLDIPNEYIFL